MEPLLAAPRERSATLPLLLVGASPAAILRFFRGGPDGDMARLMVGIAIELKLPVASVLWMQGEKMDGEVRAPLPGFVATGDERARVGVRSPTRALCRATGDAKNCDGENGVPS